MTTKTSLLERRALRSGAVSGGMVILYSSSSHKLSSDDREGKIMPATPPRQAEIDSDRLMDCVAADDNRSAFDKLCALWDGEIYKYFLRRTHEASPAGDLTQDTFRKIWRGRIHWPPFRASGGSFRPWLYTIADNTLIDRARKENKNAARPGAKDPDIVFKPIAHTGAPIEKMLIDNEIRRRIRACIGRLSALEVAVLKSRFFEDKTLEEIGAECWPDGPRATAITRARRILIQALHQMQRYLAAEGIDSVVEMTSSDDAEVEKGEVSKWLIS